MIDSPGERLARFLAHAGVASRRHAEDLIAAGRVQVNGYTIREQGSRVDPAHDVVCVDGRVIQMSDQQVHILMHKPLGYLSTVSDPQGRPTVLDLLPDEVQQLRVYPVGRLDSDTSGLLLLTNDGDFALHLTHPRYALEKHYEVLVQGQPTHTALHGQAYAGHGQSASPGPQTHRDWYFNTRFTAQRQMAISHGGGSHGSARCSRQ